MVKISFHNFSDTDIYININVYGVLKCNRKTQSIIRRHQEEQKLLETEVSDHV